MNSDELYMFTPPFTLEEEEEDEIGNRLHEIQNCHRLNSDENYWNDLVEHLRTISPEVEILRTLSPERSQTEMSSVTAASLKRIDALAAETPKSKKARYNKNRRERMASLSKDMVERERERIRLSQQQRRLDPAMQIHERERVRLSQQRRRLDPATQSRERENNRVAHHISYHRERPSQGYSSVDEFPANTFIRGRNLTPIEVENNNIVAQERRQAAERARQLTPPEDVRIMRVAQHEVSIKQL